MTVNGMLSPKELGYVGSTGQRVRADLAPQTEAMIAAAARDGVTLRITQGYRALAEQISIFLARYSIQALGTGPYGDTRTYAGRRYVRTSGASAAVPGTSNHGLGQAIDWDLSAPGALAWLTVHGTTYGWTRPAWTWQSPTVEPWHWEAVRVSVPTTGGAASTPTPPTPEDDMPLTQTDLEAIDRIIASQLDGRLRVRGTTKVPADQAGVVVSQSGKEELDRVIADRLDSRAARPLLIRNSDSGLIVADVGTGYRPLDGLEVWQLFLRLGYSLRLNLPAADFTSVVTSLGGLVHPPTAGA